MNPVRVTVLMTVYNGESYIKQAISSILQQTFTNFELLIINDGSTDDSVLIAESFQDPRIRIVHNDSNLGLVPTRNKGIKEAKGDYIAILDCDDIALPNRLFIQTKVLDNNLKIGLVASQIYLINANGNKTGKVRFNHQTEDIPAVLFFNNCIAQSSVMVRRSLVVKELYREAFPPSEDYDLWVRLAKITKIKILKLPLVLYRVHDNNISTIKASVRENAEKMIAKSQLKDLGIEPTAEEFNLHFAISKYNTFTTKHSLIDCQRWLIKLMKANVVSNCYPEHSFSKIFANRFIVICGNSGLGFYAISTFIKSPFAKFKLVSIQDVAKFIFKSLIKWQGK